MQLFKKQLIKAVVTPVKDAKVIIMGYFNLDERKKYLNDYSQRRSEHHLKDYMKYTRG